MNDPARLVTVCAECLTAACWRGIFMCQANKHAHVVKKTVAELEALNREHPDYYAESEEYPEYTEPAP